MAFPPVDRLLDHRQLRGARHRVAEPRELPVQHLPDGEELHRARQPRHLDADAASRDCRGRAGAPRAAAWGAEADERLRRRCRSGRHAEQFRALLRPAELRDPRGYIVPVGSAGLPDRDEVRQRAAQDRGHRASCDGTVHRRGKKYPAGSYVVKARRRFARTCSTCSSRRIIQTTSRIRVAADPPYDNAGWTLAFQMGVKFDRVLEGFDGPFEKVEGLLKPPAGKLNGSADAGYVFTHAMNDSFTAINRLLAAGEDVSWMTTGPSRVVFPCGQTLHVSARDENRRRPRRWFRGSCDTPCWGGDQAAQDARRARGINTGVR